MRPSHITVARQRCYYLPFKVSRRQGMTSAAERFHRRHRRGQLQENPGRLSGPSSPRATEPKRQIRRYRSSTFGFCITTCLGVVVYFVGCEWVTGNVTSETGFGGYIRWGSSDVLQAGCQFLGETTFDGYIRWGQSGQSPWLFDAGHGNLARSGDRPLCPLSSLSEAGIVWVGDRAVSPPGCLLRAMGIWHGVGQTSLSTVKFI